MTAMLSVKNWDEFQHYKDRNPPWIKLHNTLLDDYDFERLQDASKGHLLCIWMLASRTGNKIPHDAEWVSRKIGASEKVDLDGLVDAGFLVSYQPLRIEPDECSKTLALCKQDAIPEKRREEEREKANTRARFTPPTELEVSIYMVEKGLSSQSATKEASKFCQFYDSKNWIVGKVKMSKWRSSASLWVGRMDKQENNKTDTFSGFMR